MAKIKIALTRLNIRVEKKKKIGGIIRNEVTKEYLRRSQKDTITNKNKNKIIQYRIIETP